MRRVVVLHTIAPYAGLFQIAGVLDADLPNESLPLRVDGADLLGDRKGSCLLTRTADRYILYTETVADHETPTTETPAAVPPPPFDGSCALTLSPVGEPECVSGPTLLPPIDLSD